MKDLPENFTDEEHAAWIKEMEKEDRRTTLYARIITCTIVGAFLLWAFWPYINGEKNIPDWAGVWFLIIYLYYDLSKRIDKLREAIENRR